VRKSEEKSDKKREKAVLLSLAADQLMSGSAGAHPEELQA